MCVGGGDEANEEKKFLLVQCTLCVQNDVRMMLSSVS